MRPHALTALFLSTCLLEAQENEGNEFVPMFNGEDLSGWVVVNTAPSTWSFEDGMLMCTGKPIGEIRTERMYQNFILELEWRHLKPGGNAGVFVWADDITARGRPFHRGVEVQILENSYGQGAGHTTHGDIFPIHGATMTPVNGRRGSRAFPTEERSRPSPEWNHYRIECRDGDISLAVNGVVVTRGTDASPRKGYICIESEGGVVNYRNVRLLELPDTAIEREHVAIANRGYRSLYTGVDLSGWEAENQDGWVSKDWILESSGEGGSLTSTESFAEVGFVVDLALKDDEATATFSISGVSFQIQPSDEDLEPAGKWNRLEGIIREGKLEVEANGSLWRSEDVPEGSEGPILLESTGQVQWANLFVRPAPPR